jgi:hypothetical protein
MDFLTAAERNVHVTLEHRSVKTAYECQVCMKQFALRAGLSIHQRTVHGIKVRVRQSQTFLPEA